MFVQQGESQRRWNRSEILVLRLRSSWREQNSNSSPETPIVSFSVFVCVGIDRCRKLVTRLHSTLLAVSPVMPSPTKNKHAQRKASHQYCHPLYSIVCPLSPRRWNQNGTSKAEEVLSAGSRTPYAQALCAGLVRVSHAHIWASFSPVSKPTLPHHKGACYCRQRRVITASQCSAWSCSAGVRLWCLQPKGMGSTGALTARHPVCSHTHKKSCLAKNCLQLAPASPVDARVIGAGRP
jgi:hypothetical protein